MNVVQLTWETCETGNLRPEREQMAREAMKESTVNFWDGKKPCWEMCHCPVEIRSQCPAPRYPSLPCWEIEGTYLKLSDDGSKGDSNKLCRVCRVYRMYGQNEPIDIKLRGRGLDAYCRELSLRADLILP